MDGSVNPPSNKGSEASAPVYYDPVQNPHQMELYFLTGNKNPIPTVISQVTGHIQA